LPSVVALTQLPADCADPKFEIASITRERVLASNTADPAIEYQGQILRVHLGEERTGPFAVILPLDQLFEMRAAAAMRLWRALVARPLGPNPASLPKPRRDRLVLALRALDGRVEGASYREIADGLFGAMDISADAWKSHDLRDRTIRLVRLGFDTMQDGYRRLLLYPYRRR